MCVVRGCGQRANTVDHIKRRRDLALTLGLHVADHGFDR